LLRSAPAAWTRGIDGGKLIKGVKLLVICDKHGSLLDLVPVHSFETPIFA